MDVTNYVTLGRQTGLLREMDAIANNIANISTNGFRREGLVFSEFVKALEPGEDSVSMAFGNGRSLDTSQGPLTQTGGTFDFAIEGDGFFEIQTANGETYYTRDGEFSLNGAGELVTRNGHYVMDAAIPADQLDGENVLANGAVIQLNPNGGDITITDQGAILQGGVEVARLALSTFETPQALEKVGNNLYKAGEQQPIPTESRIAQGFVENSNVSPIVEMTQMIEISRAYTSVSKAITDANKLREQAIQKLAQLR
jgi:flagellar basal-body rod protein FlgF